MEHMTRLLFVADRKKFMNSLRDYCRSGFFFFVGVCDRSKRYVICLCLESIELLSFFPNLFIGSESDGMYLIEVYMRRSCISCTKEAILEVR